MKVVNKIKFGNVQIDVVNQAGMYRLVRNGNMTTQFFSTKREAENEAYAEGRKWLGIK